MEKRDDKEEGSRETDLAEERMWQAELPGLAALWLVGRWPMPCQAREGVREADVAGAAVRRCWLAT